MIQLNGEVEIRLNSNYMPAPGDSIVLWAARNFQGNPTLILPDLPEGLAWDTSELLKPTGVLKVVEATSAIASLQAGKAYICEVFTLDGNRLGTVSTTPERLSESVKQLIGGAWATSPARQGVYVVRLTDKRLTVVKKVRVQ